MMQTENIVVDRAEARALYRKYREHQHYAKPIDWEIQRTYQVIAQGKLVIRALDSIVKAGVGEDGYPKLAIVRADAQTCHLEQRRDGSARFAAERWINGNTARTKYIDFPAGAFPPPPEDGQRWSWERREATVPLVPIHLRPKRGLENYHVLWEAIWRPAPPVDPMLLRRIGEADLWVVLAAWDLTEVEQAALAARIRV
jgi:hypothetical protein